MIAQCATFYKKIWILEWREKRFGYPFPYPVPIWKQFLDIPIRLQTHYPAVYPTGKQNSDHLCPAPLPTANPRTNKERVTEFLYQAVDLPTSDCSIFTENESLVQIKVIITSHDFGTDYTSPNYTDHPQANILYIEYTVL